MTTRQILLCTGNAHKAHEVRALLGSGWEVLTLRDVTWTLDVAEDAPTFEENALQKARRGHQLSGLPALADDSGLCVDALQGGPGVRSARFAADHGRGSGDAANNALLVERLASVPDHARGARFVCAMALVDAAGTPRVFRGELLGTLGHAMRGEHGFGYDPLFNLPDGRSLAMLSTEEKNTLSHRSRALELALPAIRRAVGGVV
jgi:XTP/dITP diphosphohydrolase